MKLIDAYNEIMKSDKFKIWKLKNPNSYFSYAFTVFDGDKQDSIWDFGYYNPNSKSVSVISITNENLNIQDESKTITNNEVLPINLDNLKIDENEAFKILKKLKNKKLKKFLILKTVFILEKEKDYLIWNLTCITNSFNTWNVKIRADTGKIIKDDLFKIFHFEKNKNQ